MTEEYIVFVTNSCEQEDVLQYAREYYQIPNVTTTVLYDYNIMGLPKQTMGNKGLYYPTSMPIADYDIVIPALDDFLSNIDVVDIDFDVDYEYSFIAPYGNRLIECSVFDFEASNVMLKVVVVSRE